MTAAAMECYCGARIVEVAIPDEDGLRELVGRASWWKADDGSDRCYAGDDSMTDTDRAALHEPFGPWEE